MPPPPGNVRATVRSEQREVGATVRQVQLEFGPDHRASLSAEILIPGGNGPFPVFLTQANHRAWGQIAASRGYLTCVYRGSDNSDDTPGFVPVYPGYDWTKLMRRAWAGSRCLDYVLTLPAADKNRVLIAGHSRNGKQALMAAAFDRRITAVVSSSSGAGGSLTTRFYGEPQFGEGIELLTRAFPDWIHPRLRFFTGREDRLPIDMHDLIALIAPRSCLLATAINDKVESTWGIEQTYYAVKPVYRLLGGRTKPKIPVYASRLYSTPLKELANEASAMRRLLNGEITELAPLFQPEVKEFLTPETVVERLLPPAPVTIDPIEPPLPAGQ